MLICGQAIMVLLLRCFPWLECPRIPSCRSGKCFMLSFDIFMNYLSIWSLGPELVVSSTIPEIDTSFILWETVFFITVCSFSYLFILRGVGPCRSSSKDNTDELIFSEFFLIFIPFSWSDCKEYPMDDYFGVGFVAHVYTFTSGTCVPYGCYSIWSSSLQFSLVPGSATAALYDSFVYRGVGRQRA